MVTNALLGKTFTNQDGNHMFDNKLWNHFEARQGRGARFEEVGDVVVLMSTPRMSLVNGQNLFIDG